MVLLPEIQGMFFNSLFKSKLITLISLNFKYVDTDFRSIGAQTRKITIIH